MLNCSNDREFLGKLSAVRRAFDALLADNSVRSWFVSMGRQIIGDLMAKAEKDPSGNEPPKEIFRRDIADLL